MIHIREGPVESWGICAYEADKSLRTVRSARFRYCWFTTLQSSLFVCGCRHQLLHSPKDKFLWSLFILFLFIYVWLIKLIYVVYYLSRSNFYNNLKDLFLLNDYLSLWPKVRYHYSQFNFDESVEIIVVSLCI